MVILLVYKGKFLKGNGHQSDFKEWPCFINYHLCKISTQINECKTLAPFDLLQLTLKHYLLHASGGWSLLQLTLKHYSKLQEAGLYCNEL